MVIDISWKLTVCQVSGVKNLVCIHSNLWNNPMEYIQLQSTFYLSGNGEVNYTISLISKRPRFGINTSLLPEPAHLQKESIVNSWNNDRVIHSHTHTMSTHEYRKVLVLEEHKCCFVVLLSEKGRISCSHRMNKNTFYILHSLKINSVILWYLCREDGCLKPV